MTEKIQNIILKVKRTQAERTKEAGDYYSKLDDLKNERIRELSCLDDAFREIFLLEIIQEIIKKEKDYKKVVEKIIERLHFDIRYSVNNANFWRDCRDHRNYKLTDLIPITEAERKVGEQISNMKMSDF